MRLTTPRADVADIIGTWLPSTRASSGTSSCLQADVARFAAQLLRLTLVQVAPACTVTALSAAQANTAAMAELARNGEAKSTAGPSSQQVSELQQAASSLFACVDALLREPSVVAALQTCQAGNDSREAGGSRVAAGPRAASAGVLGPEELQHILRRCVKLEAAIRATRDAGVRLQYNVLQKLRRLEKQLPRFDHRIADELASKQGGAGEDGGAGAGGKGKRSSGGLCFEWVDAALVQAIKNGDWVSSDNAAACLVVGGDARNTR